jgi:hypothetical protein
MSQFSIDTRSYKVSKGTWVLVIVLIILGGGATFLLSHAHKRYSQQSIGPDVEARRNLYLAAQYFLNQLGRGLELRRDFSFLDELQPNHALIVSNSRKPLSKQRIDGLIRYVEQGGLLILNAVELFDDQEGASGAPILDQIGARLYGEEERGNDYFRQLREAFEDTNSSEHEISQLQFQGYPEPTKVRFKSSRYLVDASGQASYVAGTQASNHLLQYRKGKGVITVVSDMSVWNNDRIRHHDHALFLHQLTQNYDKVWLIYNPQVASLWHLLWQWGDYFLISLSVLVVFVVWFYQVKTGPVFPQFSIHSRKLLQHITAAARFKWHSGEPQLFLDQLRDELTGRIKQRSKQFAKLSQHKQVQWLSELTGLPKEKIRLALFQNYLEPSLFIEQVQTLQQIRKQINRKAS